MNARSFLLAVSFIFTAPFLRAAPDSYLLENGFFFLQGPQGAFDDELRIDPRGKGDFGDNLISHLGIGEPIESAQSFDLEKSENELIFRNLSVHLPRVMKQEEIGYPRETEEGESAGIVFETNFSFHRLEARHPTWQTHDNSVDVSLYALDRLPEDGETVRPDGLHIEPRLPSSLDDADVENLHYNGGLWNVRVTSDEVVVTTLEGHNVFKQRISDGESAVFRPWEE